MGFRGKIKKSRRGMSGTGPGLDLPVPGLGLDDVLFKFSLRVRHTDPQH